MKLSGVKVLDFGQFLSGPLVSRIMADHGAEVIKVESPEGDPTRRNRRPDQSHGDFFSALNRGKRSVVLDLKDPASRPVVEQLIAQADVLVESFTPGVTQRLGIDYARARVIRPSLVYASVTAFGQVGPLSSLPAHDPLVQAMAGTLPRDDAGKPLVSSVSLAGITAAWAALGGILMALLQARQTGQGDYVDISMHDVALSTRPQASAGALRAREAAEGWQHSMGVAMLELYQTADDKWLCLGGREPRFAMALFNALGRPDLATIATGPTGAAQDPVRDFLRSTFRTRTQSDWLTSLPTELSIAPVLNHAQALAHPHVQARGMVIDADGSGAFLNTPLRFASQPGRAGASVPSLGAATEAVLAALGVTHPTAVS